MPELIAPTTRLRATWRSAHAQWGPGLHEDGFGLSADDDTDSPAGFAAWVARLGAEEQSSDCLYRWIVNGDEVLGGIAARWGDTETVRRHGNIGYGITPSARGRGVATWALGQVLGELAARGVEDVVAVCLADNTASAATLERNGGRLEPAAADSRVRRYRVTARNR